MSLVTLRAPPLPLHVALVAITLSLACPILATGREYDQIPSNCDWPNRCTSSKQSQSETALGLFGATEEEQKLLGAMFCCRRRRSV